MHRNYGGCQRQRARKLASLDFPRAPHEINNRSRQLQGPGEGVPSAKIIGRAQAECKQIRGLVEAGLIEIGPIEIGNERAPLQRYQWGIAGEGNIYEVEARREAKLKQSYHDFAGIEIADTYHKPRQVPQPTQFAPRQQLHLQNRRAEPTQ